MQGVGALQRARLRRRRAVLNSVCNAGSYCGALVGPQSRSTRSQGSKALAVRDQRYAVDAFCSQFARRLKKWSRLAVCKTLAIKRSVAASLNTHEFPRKLYHTAHDHSQVRPLLVSRSAESQWQEPPERSANRAFRHARLLLTRERIYTSTWSACIALRAAGAAPSSSHREECIFTQEYRASCHAIAAARTSHHSRSSA